MLLGLIIRRVFSADHAKLAVLEIAPFVLSPVNEAILTNVPVGREPSDEEVEASLFLVGLFNPAGIVFKYKLVARNSGKDAWLDAETTFVEYVHQIGRMNVKRKHPLEDWASLIEA